MFLMRLAGIQPECTYAASGTGLNASHAYLTYQRIL